MTKVGGLDDVDDPEINKFKQINVFNEIRTDTANIFTNIVLDSYVDSTMNKIPALKIKSKEEITERDSSGNYKFSNISLGFAL